MATHISSEQRLWLFSRRVDFWLASGGAAAALIAAALVIAWHGDREIDALDFVVISRHGIEALWVFPRISVRGLMDYGSSDFDTRLTR